MCFALADRLGLSVAEVEEWPVQTLKDWEAYLTIRQREAEKK